jgi:hypothetical protein
MRRVNPNTRISKRASRASCECAVFGRLDTLFRKGSIFCSRLHDKAPESTRYFGDETENQRKARKRLVRVALPCSLLALRGIPYQYSGALTCKLAYCSLCNVPFACIRYLVHLKLSSSSIGGIPLRVLWRLAVWSLIDGPRPPTPGYQTFPGRTGEFPCWFRGTCASR